MILEHNLRQVMLLLSVEIMPSHGFVQTSASCSAFWRVFVWQSAYSDIPWWCDLSKRQMACIWCIFGERERFPFLRNITRRKYWLRLFEMVCHRDFPAICYIIDENVQHGELQVCTKVSTKNYLIFLSIRLLFATSSKSFNSAILLLRICNLHRGVSSSGPTT